MVFLHKKMMMKMDNTLDTKKSSLEDLRILTERLTIRDDEYRKNCKKFTMILSQIPCVVLATTDLDYTITECFGKSIKCFGVKTNEELIGKNISDIYHELKYTKKTLDHGKLIKNINKDVSKPCGLTSKFNLKGCNWTVSIDKLIEDQKKHIGYIFVFIRECKNIHGDE